MESSAHTGAVHIPKVATGQVGAGGTGAEEAGVGK